MEEAASVSEVRIPAVCDRRSQKTGARADGGSRYDDQRATTKIRRGSRRWQVKALNKFPSQQYEKPSVFSGSESLTK